jgi:predicted N-acetyltransferase YhbS
MLIDYLADHREFVAELAPLLHEEWGRLRPGSTLADRVALLERHCQREALPLGLVAHEEGRLCGTASLSASDFAERRDLTPWLAGVYVLAEFRGRGLGARLVRAVEQEAIRLGFSSLHLVTAGQESFYGSLGWRTLESRRSGSEAVTIMGRSLR